MACNEDNAPSYSNEPPVINLSTQEITATAGSTVSIQGQVTDDFGVKFLTIFSGALAINTQIDVSTRNEIRSSYQLSFELQVPHDLSGDEYTIQISAKNLTGQVTNRNIRLIVTQ
ncbi:hypothetical protein [Aquiflexum sp.]|uniref:hypothetical protein n=1 Tax=Aquiflexum sp. TaxID=1872584 RepID=UPI0035942FDD